MSVAARLREPACAVPPTAAIPGAGRVIRV
jgi:hypothetical protein